MRERQRSPDMVCPVCSQLLNNEQCLICADSYLNDILAQLDSYTVFYTTRPVSADDYQEIQHPDPSYEMDSPFPAGMHGDLKRDLGVHVSAANTSNLYSNVPLFEKYQFVNQGKFDCDD